MDSRRSSCAWGGPRRNRIWPSCARCAAGCQTRFALMTDYNQALTVTEAIRRGQALDGEGVYWIEEPTRHDDYAGCARIAAALKTPVQIWRELRRRPAMATALAAGACDYVMPDLERIGGVTGWGSAPRHWLRR